MGRTKSQHRPREVRRCVALPARMRTGAQWSDACILNISSRGLMIHSGRAGPEGSTIELRRGGHIIIAQVVWRDGARVGLQSKDRLPVEEIMSLGQSKTLRQVASDGSLFERCKSSREEHVDRSRWGRVAELARVAAVIVCVVLSVWTMAQGTFARPIAKLEAALGI